MSCTPPLCPRAHPSDARVGGYRGQRVGEASHPGPSPWPSPALAHEMFVARQRIREARVPPAGSATARERSRSPGAPPTGGAASAASGVGSGPGPGLHTPTDLTLASAQTSHDAPDPRERMRSRGPGSAAVPHAPHADPLVAPGWSISGNASTVNFTVTPGASSSNAGVGPCPYRAPLAPPVAIVCLPA